MSLLGRIKQSPESLTFEIQDFEVTISLGDEHGEGRGDVLISFVGGQRIPEGAKFLLQPDRMVFRRPGQSAVAFINIEPAHIEAIRAAAKRKDGMVLVNRTFLHGQEEIAEHFTSQVYLADFAA